MRQLALLAVALAASMALAGCTLPFGSFVDNGRPGSAAKQILDPREYPKLVVEIDHPAGYAPNAEAKQVLKNTLMEVTGRDAASITLVEDASIPAEPSRKYSYDEIAALEQRHRDHRTGGDTATLYVIYLAGGSTGDEGDNLVLGAVYKGTSIVMFKGNVKSASKGSGLLDQRPEERCVERAVLVHEFGHAAGLVNIGAPMVRPHEDPNNPGHSSNKQSVMYWAIEGSGSLLDLFGSSCSSIPYQFDADDKADLKALRDR